MNNRKYSSFELNQIITPNYEALCKQLLDVVKNEKIRERCRKILYQGGYDDFSVNSEMTNNRPYIEREKRLQFAYLLATNPETFEIISKSNVNLFHGTNANALPGILQYGMKSGHKLSEMGLTVTTGEEWSRKLGQRNWISFTDYLVTAIDYASIQSSNNDSQKSSFGILIGISSNDAKNKETRSVQGCNLQEAAIIDDIPLEDIKVILAPEDKVQFVRKLVGDKGITVSSMDLNLKVYIDLIELLIHYDSQKARKLFNITRQSTKKTTFDSMSMKKLAKDGIMSNIKNIYAKIKEKIKSRGKVNGDDTKYK